MAATDLTSSRLEELLGDDAQSLLTHKARFDASNLHLPGPDFIDRIFVDTDSNTNVLRQLQWLQHSGRLSGTGYVPAPAVSFSPGTLTFGTQAVGTTSATQPAVLRNTGTATGTTVRLTYRLPADTQVLSVDGGGATCSVALPDVTCSKAGGLGIGQEVSTRLEVKLPARLPGGGGVTVQLTADPQNQVGESNENNNKAQVVIPMH